MMKFKMDVMKIHYQIKEYLTKIQNMMFNKKEY